MCLYLWRNKTSFMTHVLNFFRFCKPGQGALNAQTFLISHIHHRNPIDNFCDFFGAQLSEPRLLT